MLELQSIKKDYVTSSETVCALKGIDIAFRDKEFVSILGPSGCGKTTLLNIVGGLDKYTSGDLVINGRSTKLYKDRDWDVYRNHRVGFIFQSYNLIPHQTVLANVELALTIAGFSKEERVAKAKAALDKVGLSNQYYKRPNQLSGGQCQRVAIARALVNDPEILLADEPTGALDTVTSVQIMNLVREIAEERLVIMVTHNPELAEEYSTRIVRLLDGNIIEDTNPVSEEELIENHKLEEQRALAEAQEAARIASGDKAAKKEAKKKKEKAKMSFLTALSLSLNNLATKKGRTVMTSFAGSIGIIGIALILALSTGINAFIAQVQEDTLSAYPLIIQKSTQDMAAMLSAMTSVSNEGNYRDSGMIHVDDSLGTMMGAMSSTVENNLAAFKQYIDENYDDIKDFVSDIQYTYDYNMQVYTADGKVKVGMETIFAHMGDAFAGMSDLMEMSGGMAQGFDVFSEMINNQDLLDQQYEVISGNWPKEYNEVVLVVNSNNQISKMTLYMLGMIDPDEIDKELEDLVNGKYESKEIPPFTYEDILNTRFKLLTTADFFTESGKTYKLDGSDTEYPIWNDLRDSFGFDQGKFIAENGLEIKISGIIRPKDGAAATSISGAVGYTKALTDYILSQNESSKVINQQKATPTVNVLTGLAFERTKYTPKTIHELVEKIDEATMNMFYSYMTEQILQNPEFSDRIQVTDTNSFLGMFMLLPAEKQTEIFSAVLEGAKAKPAGTSVVGLNALCGMLSMSTGGITITPDNFVRLLPVLDMRTHVMAALVGIPKTEQLPVRIPGLIEMAGEETMEAIYKQLTDSIKTMTVNNEIFIALLSTLSEDDEAFIQLEETLYNMAPGIDATYDSVLEILDDAEKAEPASINFYAKDFASKNSIEQFIKDYNSDAKADGREKDEIKYTDIVGAMMSSVTVIIDAISYVLIAFVSISLVVSSIMIGIITNISVLERIKEIGILRAIGASKKDVSRVFNAETLIIGLAAGAIGILTTLILCVPITAIVQYFTGLDNIRAILPWEGAVVLVVISMVLTLIAGIIPSRSAAKKDPVVALRTE